MNKDFKAIRADYLSMGDESRYIIINSETGEVLDDAQGYGFKTAQKAIACWNYKNIDKDKMAEREVKRNVIRKWMKEHKSFIKLMDSTAFDIAKGSWGANERFDSKVVKLLLEENNLTIDFTPYELLRVWERG